MKYHCLAYGDEKDWNALTKSERETPLAQDKLLRRRNTPFVVRTLVRFPFGSRVCDAVQTGQVAPPAEAMRPDRSGPYIHKECALVRSLGAPFVVRTLVRSLGAQAGREVGLAAQAFALLGTLVGIFTIAIGIGPRTVPDLVYHATIVGVLVWGLTVAAQTHSHASDQHA